MVAVVAAAVVEDAAGVVVAPALAEAGAVVDDWPADIGATVERVLRERGLL